MTMRRFVVVRALMLLPALVVVPALASGAHAGASRTSLHTASRPRARTTWDSVFTAEQAARGQTAYNQTCARCHRETLAGGDEAPALSGSAFLGNWNGLTLDDLHERIRTTMPTDTPGVYGRQQVTDVIAFVLRFNGFPAGSAELTHENDALKGIRFVSTKP